MDSICINQQDEAERSAQVAQMGAIYHSAARVVVWLGEEEDGSHDAIRFLHELGWDDATPDSTNAEEIRIQTRSWKAVEHLLARPWWKRVWTMQEILLGERAVFCCGGSSINRRELKFGVEEVREWAESSAMPISRKAYEKAWHQFQI